MIKFGLVSVDRLIEHPEFTPNGAYIPQEYFEVFERFHRAVVTELDRKDFLNFVTHSIMQGIEPENGFVEWIMDATLATWMVAMKKGYHSLKINPKGVAEQIILVAREMHANALLLSVDTEGMIKH